MKKKDVPKSSISRTTLKTHREQMPAQLTVNAGEFTLFVKV